MTKPDFFLTISKTKQKITGLSIANDNGDVSQRTDTKPVKKRFTIKNDTGAVLSVTKSRSYRKAIKTNVSPITISKANLQLNDIECGNKKSAAENNDLLHQVIVNVDLIILAPKVLLDYLRPMISNPIPSQSHPHIAVKTTSPINLINLPMTTNNYKRLTMTTNDYQ